MWLHGPCHLVACKQNHGGYVGPTILGPTKRGGIKVAQPLLSQARNAGRNQSGFMTPTFSRPAKQGPKWLNSKGKILFLFLGSNKTFPILMAFSFCKIFVI